MPSNDPFLPPYFLISHLHVTICFSLQPSLSQYVVHGAHPPALHQGYAHPYTNPSQYSCIMHHSCNIELMTIVRIIVPQYYLKILQMFFIKSCKCQRVWLTSYAIPTMYELYSIILVSNTLTVSKQ